MRKAIISFVVVGVLFISALSLTPVKHLIFSDDHDDESYENEEEEEEEGGVAKQFNYLFQARAT